MSAESTSPPAGGQTVPTGQAPRIEDRLANARQWLARREPEGRARLEEIAQALEALEKAPETRPADDLAARKEKLIAESASLQKELKHLEAARASWQKALDARESAARTRQELERFEAEGRLPPPDVTPAQVTALQAQLTQIETALQAMSAGEAARAERQGKLAGEIETALAWKKAELTAERAALEAAAAADQHQRAALSADRALLDARLKAAQQKLGDAGPESRPAETAPSPATGDRTDAQFKEQVARELEAETRDRLGYAREQLKEIQAKLERAPVDSPARSRLQNDREYWQRVEVYEQRQLDLVELHHRAAQIKSDNALLRDRIEQAAGDLEQLRRTHSRLVPRRRGEQADQFDQQAAAAEDTAAALGKQAGLEAGKIAPLRQHMTTLDALDNALAERLQNLNYEDYERFATHFDRMKAQFRGERQQVDLMIMTAEYIGFALRRQASLERELAGLYRTCADVLVPPFWERHRKTLNSLVVVLVVVAISYGVKLGIWLTQRIVARVGAILAVRGAGFSVKRATTLLSFAGSIIKLFVWIFGAVAVLNEFGIDPAASTGAIGLIGLIMAGMFQQIVIDFVKGLDIIAGRHYNVGDFVELDGKLGHVVDISVKHTRIRTLSGQEFNLPNSRCVPSRRFPEGFVDNYVDVVLASSADEAQAKEAIAPVCADLNRRLEPIRSEPILDFRFLGPEDQATLRYLVRVLPGCDWVVTDHFIPAIKEALQKRGVHLASEPTFCFINRIATFRKLFSRQLTEEEIIRETRNEASTLQGRDTPASAGPPPTAGG